MKQTQTETDCQVEVFMLTAERPGQIGFVRKIGKVAGDPDQTARKLIGTAIPVWLHSTSWRYEGGALVLTYLAYCDFLDRSNCPTEYMWTQTLALAFHDKPLQPSSITITTSQVLDHGLRHIAFLANHLDENPWLKKLDESTLAWFQSLQPSLAGKLAVQSSAT